MYVIPRTPTQHLVALGCSIALVLVIYLAVIRPNNNTANRAINTANQALRQGEQQVQQAVAKDQAAAKSSGASSSGAPAIPASVSNVTSCIAQAGTDVDKVQACDVKFKP